MTPAEVNSTTGFEAVIKATGNTLKQRFIALLDYKEWTIKRIQARAKSEAIGVLKCGRFANLGPLVFKSIEVVDYSSRLL
jgi:hypothetical protein